MKKLIWSTLLIILSVQTFGQELSVTQKNKVDSLQLELLKDHHDTVLVEVLFEIANEFYLHNGDTAMHYCKIASQKSDALNYYSGMVNSTVWLGYLFWQKGELNQALEAYKAGLEIVKGDDFKNRGDLLNSMGYVYKDIGDIEKGLELLLQSLDNSRMAEDSVNISVALNNIGTIYQEIDDLDKALTYFSESIEMRIQIGDRSETGYTLNNIGTIYGQKGEIDKARKVYFESLELAINKNNLTTIAMVYGNLGLNYRGNNQLDSSYIFFEKSLEFSKKAKSKYWEIGAYIGMAKLQKDKQNWNEMLIVSSKAHALASTSEYPLRLKGASELLYIGYSKIDDWENAYKYHNEFILLRDSIVNTKNKKEVYQKEMKYKFKQTRISDSLVNLESEKVLNAQIETQKAVAAKEKKEKEQNILWTILGASILTLIVFFLIRSNGIRKKNNMMLSDKNAEIEKTSHKLSETLGERNLLLKEIHHRVKNNLQTVSSLLSLQSRYLDDPNATKALKESQNRLLSISLLHQKLYQNENQPVIVFSEYLKELCEQVKNTCSKDDKEIEVEIVSDDLTCDIELAMPLGLIVNELMTNSYKYAFKDKKTGKITVSFCTLGEGKFQLQVKDNGIGLPEGFSMNHKNSMGLNLVKLLTKQLKGKITIAGNEGASFTLNFEKKKYR